VRANGDAWQWWGATAGAVRTALDLEGAQTISGAKTFTGAVRVDPNLGVGVTPAVWAGRNALQVGQAGSVAGDTGFPSLVLSSNSYTDGVNRALVTGVASQLSLSGGGVAVYTAPSVAAAAAQAFTQRFAVGPTGTVTLAPDVGAPAIENTGVGGLRLNSAGTPLYLQSNTVGVMCPTDNFNALGDSTHRWNAVYAVNGTIQTSSADMKQDITPLDPAACYQAAKDVVWYDFRYLPPGFTAPEPGPDTAYDEHDSNEAKAEKRAAREAAETQAKAAYAKMLVETAPARHQRGFVFPAGEAKDEAGAGIPPVPDLFGLDDRESTTPQADLATLGCALQEVIRRLEALEGAAP
jgi:hypothetical protein